MNNILNNLSYKKIEMNWNKNPIKVDTLLSFLTVDTIISRDHLGSDNGWTQMVNEDIKLVIKGGIVNGINYLDSIQYGIKLQNQYNNYVNPFALFDIMNEEGKRFFVEYYRDDLKEIRTKAIKSVYYHEKQIDIENEIAYSVNGIFKEFGVE